MKYETICSYQYTSNETNGTGLCFQSLQSDISDITLTEINNLLDYADKSLKEKGYTDIKIFPMLFTKVIDDTNDSKITSESVSETNNFDPNEVYDEIKRIMNSGSLFMKSEEKEQKLDQIRKLLA